MASRTKDSSGVKDKSGKSPSHLRHTTDPSQRRTSPHPPSANSTNVPNYLRPTASSRSDTSKSPTAKKPSLNITVENTPHKPNINRRRSLDNKAPSTSQLFKSQPTSSDKSPNKPKSTLHSPTSYIVKPKPLPGKDSKAFSKDAGKSTTSPSRPGKTVKKNITNSTVGSSTNTKKQKSAVRNALATKPHHTIDREAKHEPVQEDGNHKSLFAESEDEEKGTNQVEDKDHLDDAQHNEGEAEGDHQSEDTEESDEEMKKLPDPFKVYAKQKTTTPFSEGANRAATATEKEDIEARELHRFDGPQIEDKVEEDDTHKNTHENHHHHQQKESFESEPMDEIDNVERSKLEITEEYPKQNMVEKEEVNDEENTENKSEHDTQEDKVESEEEKGKTKVKGDEAEVNIAQLEVKEEETKVTEENTDARRGNPEVKDQKAYIQEQVQEPDVKDEQREVTDQRPDIEVHKTDVKEEETKVNDQRVDIEELKPYVKEEEQGVEEEKREVKEEKPEVKEEESEGMEKNKSEQFEEKAKAEEEKQANEGVKEEKSEVMQKKMVWRTTSSQLGNKKDNNSNSNAYNNVIEETASKLKEQRKNKVLALVGAFETVISLEDPDSETPRGN